MPSSLLSSEPIERWTRGSNKREPVRECGFKSATRRAFSNSLDSAILPLLAWALGLGSKKKEKGMTSYSLTQQRDSAVNQELEEKARDDI